MLELYQDLILQEVEKLNKEQGEIIDVEHTMETIRMVDGNAKSKLVRRHIRGKIVWPGNGGNLLLQLTLLL